MFRFRTRPRIRVRPPSRKRFALAALLLLPLAAHPQVPEPTTTFQVQVDEVTLPFRAYDANGHPVADLRLPDLSLRDNGKPPRRILSFARLTGQPIRVGILLDVSASIEGDSLSSSQDIASAFTGEFLRPPSDQAFVLQFDFDQKFLSGWLANRAALGSAISSAGRGRGSRMGGTAIYDALYRGVRDQIAQQTLPGQTSNAIILFSDGDDNASHARFTDVIEICQRTNTAIYVFSANPKSAFNTGEKDLRSLTAQTGGRLFFDRDPDGIRRDLRTVEDDLRDYYLVVYRPARLKPNGAFHPVRLQSLRPGVAINARAGYYAPGAPR
ncbi:MAG TPA: VWA domain-containing protein [Acidobacteriaceae bacterium]|jgi:VWFA-related protein|nr:VWA domain-containing protein [Acidobacteriaceae bacterium]